MAEPLSRVAGKVVERLIGRSSRRRLQSSAGAAVLGAALGAAGGRAAAAGSRWRRATRTATSQRPDPAGGCRSTARTRPGIATPAQDRLAFAAFDLTSLDRTTRDGRCSAPWAAAAARMTDGLPIGRTETRPQAPPIDTGEALGLRPANLTVTVGFGPSLFDDRFGLADQAPGRAPAASPALPGDSARPAIAAAVTSACRPAPTTRRSPSTSSATSPGSGVARW